MAEFDVIFDNLPEDEEKTTPQQDEKIRAAAEKLRLTYDPQTGEFKTIDGGIKRDLRGANKMVGDLTQGVTDLPKSKMADILTDTRVADFSEKIFGDKSKTSVDQARNIFGRRVGLDVRNGDISAEIKPSDATGLIKSETSTTRVGVVEKVVGENGVKQTKDIKNVEDLTQELAKTKAELQKANVRNAEFEKSLGEIEKTLKDKGDKIQEMANKTTAEMKKDGTWKDTAGKALMVLLASFIAYVSIDELVNEMSGCFVTTKKDGMIVSKCKLADFTCCDPEQKKDGIYLLCNNLGDFYDSSSTNETCLDKDKKIYKDDGYFKANVCTGDGNGTDNGGMCKSCNSTNPCLTKNGTDNGDKITYEYTCVKADAMSALGFIMGGLINLVKDTTSGVFTAKWLWYVLFIAAGIMGVYLIFEFLKAYILSRAEKSA